MINIEVKQNSKIPGPYSAFVHFDYDAKTVETIKTAEVYNYDKKTYTWEIPLNNLSRLLDQFVQIDEVNLTYEEQKEKNKKPLTCKTEFKTNPYPYQKEGIDFGINHDKWLLLDAPGLGKTLQILYIAQELRCQKKVEHCLIVCGINNLKSNWKKEIQTHSNLSARILGERVNKKGRTVIGSVKDRLSDLKKPLEEFFIITNIETLRDDDIVKKINSGPNKFDMIVVDEIHCCKSPTSQQGKNLLKLKDFKYKIGATGTLIMNNPLDAYVPLRFIDAERCTYTNFKFYYCNYTGPFHNILLNYKHIGDLKKTIDENSLRRTKDILGLPPKVIINEYVDMEGMQETFYKHIVDGVVDEVDKVEINTSSLLAMVARLRQATACPSMLTSENIPSNKIDRCVSLCEEIISGGNKVVVFSTFKETTKILEEKLSQYNPVVCTGDVKDDVVSHNIDEFQKNDNVKVFIGTWQKCGTGITLTAAQYMIFIDTPWTDAVYTQAQDRIYRIGTKGSVFIYNLICKDTIDERVLEIVNSKQAIADFVVDDKVSEKSLEILKGYIEELSDKKTII